MTLELSPTRPPAPPVNLILRVTPPFDADERERGIEAFDLDALEHLRKLENGLSVVGRSFRDFNRLLDFGCGCGRFLRHLGQLADAVEIHGTDIDVEMVDWLKNHVPYGSFTVASHDPPLEYPDGYFDLILNHSVFTHLDESYQDRWLAELQRITSPGALLLLTVEGMSSWQRLCASHQGYALLPRWRDELEERGILFVRDDAFIGSTHPDFYHSTFHTPWYVFRHWSRFFDIVAYLPNGSDTQDLVVLRRRADDTAPASVSHVRAHHTVLTHARSILRSARSYARRFRSDPLAMNRELDMLRVGMYEQSKRISSIAADMEARLDAVSQTSPATRGDHYPSDA